MSTDPRVSKYKRYNRFCYLVALAVFIIACLFALYSISMTNVKISFTEMLDILWKHLNGIVPVERTDIIKDTVIWDEYMPRAVAGVIVGAVLGMSGAAIQTATRNPITDSYTTGISSGALFGVTIFVILDISLFQIGGTLGMVLNAFVFALVPCAVIVLVSVFRKITPTMMILIGIGMMYLFSACTTMLKYTADPEKIEEIFEWNVGSLARVGPEELSVLVLAALILFIGLMVLSKSSNILMAGENTAHSMGVDPLKLRVVIFVVVSISTAMTVCFAGSIGFVGLVVPHIVRRLFKSSGFTLVALSGSFGALLLLVSDVIAKHIAVGMNLPVGIITAMIGSPLFLYLLTKNLKKSSIA